MQLSLSDTLVAAAAEGSQDVFSSLQLGPCCFINDSFRVGIGQFKRSLKTAER